MRLGQGCRRRSPWWCWAVMLATAAVVLPGGAFVVSAEKGEDGTVLSPAPAASVMPFPDAVSQGEQVVVPAGRDQDAPLPRASAPAPLPHAAFVIEVVCIEGESRAVDGIADRLQMAASAASAHRSANAWQPVFVEDDLEDVVRRVQKQEDVRVLASPRLVTESGRTASIQIGGEVPYGVQDSQGKGPRFVNVGLQMQFVPTMLSTGIVRLDYDVKDSRLEPSDAAQDDEKPRHAVHLRTCQVSAGVEVALGKVMAVRSSVWQAENTMRTLFLIRVDRSDADLPVAEGQADGQLAWDLLGLQLEPIPEDEFRRDFNARYRGGLRIVKVRPDSPAAGEALKAGDVLVGLHSWETRSLKNANYVLNRPDLKEFLPLKYYLLRDNETLYGHIDLAERLSESRPSWEKQGQLVRAYEVADLATGARIPQSLSSLITETIAPQTWLSRGGAGRIQVEHDGKLLVIEQTKDVHEEIADLLAQIRHTQRLQVVVRTQTVEVSEEFCRKHWKGAPSQEESVVLDSAAFAGLLADLRSNDSTRLTEGPTARLFNGQQIEIPIAILVGTAVIPRRLVLHPNVSGENQNVYLQADIPPSTLHNERKELKSGEALALEISQPAEASATSRRTFVLVTSEIVAPQEEAEQPIAAAGRESEQD